MSKVINQLISNAKVRSVSVNHDLSKLPEMGVLIFKDVELQELIKLIRVEAVEEFMNDLIKEAKP